MRQLAHLSPVGVPNLECVINGDTKEAARVNIVPLETHGLTQPTISGARGIVLCGEESGRHRGEVSKNGKNQRGGIATSLSRGLCIEEQQTTITVGREKAVGK